MSSPEVLAKGSPDPVPALLLGRLAVDHRYSRLGIGTALVAHDATLDLTNVQYLSACLSNANLLTGRSTFSSRHSPTPAGGRWSTA